MLVGKRRPRRLGPAVGRSDGGESREPRNHHSCDAEGRI